MPTIIEKGTPTSHRLLNYEHVHIGTEIHTFFNGRVCPHCGQAIRNSQFCTGKPDLSADDARYFYERLGLEVFEDEPMYAPKSACPSCGKLSYERAKRSHTGRNILRGSSLMVMKCLLGAEGRGVPSMTRREVLTDAQHRFGDKAPKDSTIRILLWSLVGDGWLEKTGEPPRDRQEPLGLTAKAKAKLAEGGITNPDD